MQSRQPGVYPASPSSGFHNSLDHAVPGGGRMKSLASCINRFLPTGCILVTSCIEYQQFLTLVDYRDVTHVVRLARCAARYLSVCCAAQCWVCGGMLKGWGFMRGRVGSLLKRQSEGGSLTIGPNCAQILARRARYVYFR